ncbi:hypothetical protein NDU88_003553 [Pleurodeles waltl]|uniref:Uncharacterized protein n=1 Tax=Pleurodeles waltl TaxID=8319 RepID=A0AAV7VGE8_PLEWA|nr:hypothetical protein NDU88_003553 [Pleurodeles waltl]
MQQPPAGLVLATSKPVQSFQSADETVLTRHVPLNALLLCETQTFHRVKLAARLSIARAHFSLQADDSTARSREPSQAFAAQLLLSASSCLSVSSALPPLLSITVDDSQSAVRLRALQSGTRAASRALTYTGIIQPLTFRERRD